MNLAIEYILRTGELKKNLDFPYSLFTDSATDDKIAITIHRAFHPSKVSVKHWKVTECDKSMAIPPFEEHQIPLSELFESNKVVISGRSLLWYKEEPFRAGRQQHPDSPLAEEDEKEYCDTLNNFLFSKRHREARVEWLWQAFLKVYGIELTGFVSVHKNSQIDILRQHAPSVASNWIRWRRYMMDLSSSSVAGELTFHSEYAELCRREGRGQPSTAEFVPERWRRIKFQPAPSGAGYFTGMFGNAYLSSGGYFASAGGSWSGTGGGYSGITTGGSGLILPAWE